LQLDSRRRWRWPAMGSGGAVIDVGNGIVPCCRSQKVETKVNKRKIK
jgi:hypothetical protein